MKSAEEILKEHYERHKAKHPEVNWEDWDDAELEIEFCIPSHANLRTSSAAMGI